MSCKRTFPSPERDSGENASTKSHQICNVKMEWSSNCLGQHTITQIPSVARNLQACYSGLLPRAKYHSEMIKYLTSEPARHKYNSSYQFILLWSWTDAKGCALAAHELVTFQKSHLRVSILLPSLKSKLNKFQLVKYFQASIVLTRIFFLAGHG